MLEVKVPAVGESVTQGVILQWFKKDGEVVAANDNLYELETDKITMPIATEVAGLLSIKKPAGSTVLVGETVALVDPKGSSSLPRPATVAPPAQAPAPAFLASAPAKAPALAPSAPSAPAKAPIPAASFTPSGPPVPIAIPEVGESITKGVILQWYKKDGDFVLVNDNLYELETDKITMPIATEVAGVLSIAVPAKTTVAIKQVIGRLQPGTPPLAAATATAPAPSAAAPSAAPLSSAPLPTFGGVLSEVVASPAARFHAEQNHLPLASIQGTGKDGRVMKEDVLRTLQNPLPPSLSAPVAAPAAPAPAAPSASAPSSGAASSQRQRREPMTSIRKRIAERLVYAQQTAAMLTTFNELDMTALMDLRTKYNEAFSAKYGVKLGFMSFFVKAAVDALKLIPALNAYIDGEDIVYNQFYDIGVAVGTDKGLVVPVVRDADKLSFAGIEKAIGDLAKRAKDRKLTLQDLSGASFTVTNGGVYGSLLSTPILNPPQSGILGMHGIKKRPVVVNDKIEIRPMMYVAMTYDHRIIDGKEAVTFLKRIVECVENPERLLLEI